MYNTDRRDDFRAVSYDKRLRAQDDNIEGTCTFLLIARRSRPMASENRTLLVFPYTLKKTGGPAIKWDTPFDNVNGPPRGAGAHARLLRLVREKKVDIPLMLMLAVSKMSYMIANFMEDNGVPQMARKGRIQVGCDADITLFDPSTVGDNSTMQTGGLPSTGIPYVIVNGTIVVKDSTVLEGVFAGQAVRREVGK